MFKTMIMVVLCIFTTNVYATSLNTDMSVGVGCDLDLSQFKNNATIIEYYSDPEYCFEEDDNENMILDRQCCITQEKMLQNYDQVCTLISEPVKQFIKKASKGKSSIHKKFKKLVRNNKVGVVDVINKIVMDEKDFMYGDELYEHLTKNQEDVMEQCLKNVERKKDKAIEGC